MLNGIYPTIAQLKQSIVALKHEEHTDWTISNMIVQGSNVQLIDYNDPYYGKARPHKNYAKKRFEQVLKLISFKHPDNVARYFRNVYTKRKKKKK